MKKVNLTSRNVVFFDGVCHLCNGFVDTIISRDKNHFFFFAPLQGTTAESLLTDQDRKRLDTVIYYEAGKTYYRSSAILKIICSLGGKYKLFCVAWLIPSILRDLIYNFIAKNRYAWFGQRELCRFPSPDERLYLLP